MKNKTSFCRPMHVNKFLIALILLVCPLAYTYAACCAGHGGVASCNQTTGFQMCKDGSVSPTCKCQKAKTPKKTTAPKATPATKTAPAKAVKSTTTTGTKSAKGCCSKHGGVDQCNKSTGYLVCKDKTQSASCTCR